MPLGLLAVVCAIAFRLLIPKARHLLPGRSTARAVAHGHRPPRQPAAPSPVRHRPALHGGFGAVYTVLGYRLTEEPFNLSQTAIGLFFLVYLVGTAASAGSGVLLARLGRRGALYVAVAVHVGLLLSLSCWARSCWDWS